MKIYKAGMKEILNFANVAVNFIIIKSIQTLAGSLSSVEYQFPLLEYQYQCISYTSKSSYSSFPCYSSHMDTRKRSCTYREMIAGIKTRPKNTVKIPSSIKYLL